MIIPFSKTNDSHNESYWIEFYKVIYDIMIENGYDCSKSEIGPYNIFSNIVENLEESDIVIAVLTDYNANVWYELGIRHTLKSGTIMLLQENQYVSFDIKSYGIILYKDSCGMEKFLKNEINKYIKKNR